MPSLERGKRARSEEEKESRRASIVGAARSLFARREYGAISAEDIAREAGLSKGSLFFYFPTKEEVFLALSRELFGEFFAAASAGFDAQPDPSGDLSSPPAGEAPEGGAGERHSDLVEGLSALVARSGELLKMMGILDAVVERNVSRESLAEYKRYLEGGIGELAEKAGARFPLLRGDRGRRFFVWLYGIARGFRSLAEPGALASSIIEAEGIELFSFDFEREFAAALRALLAGMEAGTR